MEGLDTPVEETGTEEIVEPPNSVRALLRERRRELSENKTIDLEVPGQGDLLKIRYGALPSEELNALVERIRKANRVNGLAVNADFLIRCCQGVLMPISADEGAPFDVVVDDEDDPLSFDKRLADLLGIEAERAREVVYGVFSTAPQPDLAIGSHVQKIIAWMQGAESEADSAILDF